MQHSEKSTRPILWTLSFILCLLVGITSLWGLTEPSLYKQETFNWQVQTIGQDFINLVMALPLLGVSLIFMSKKNHIGIYMAIGAIAYLGYTYVIYCFSLHFNVLFIPYCMALGLCFFSIVLFLSGSLKTTVYTSPSSLLNNITGIYFILTALLFFFLWTAEIISSQRVHSIPQSLVDTDLSTNPVHVLDLSIALPAIFVVGLMILRKKKTGSVMAPVVLTFFVLMDMTIGTLNVLMAQAGFPSQPLLTTIMYIKGLFSLLLLFLHLRKNEKSK